MAYREFSNEKLTESPNLGDLPNTLQALSFVNQQKLLQQQRQYNAVQDIKNFEITSKIPKYVRGLTEMAKNFADTRVNEIYHGQVTASPQAVARYTQGTNLNKQAAANEEEVKNLRQRILDIKGRDKYYKAENDLEKTDNAIVDDGSKFGPEMIDKDQAHISTTRNSIYSDEEVLKNFDSDTAASDWVQQQKHGQKSIEQSFKGLSGGKNASLYTGIFFDDAGKPGITDAKVNEFLTFHPKLTPYYTHLVMNDLMKQISQNRAADPSWMNGKSDAEALSAIIQNPALNINSQGGKPMNQLIRDKARKKLGDLEAITRKIDTDLSDQNPSAEAGITSKDVSASEIFDANNSVSGPGRSISRNKPATHPYFKFTARSPRRKDIDTGEDSTDNMPHDFTLNSIQLVPVDGSGKIVGFNAKNADDLERQINEAPLSSFGPKGITGTKMAFRGQTIDKSVMEEAIKKRDELEADYVSNPNDTNLKSKLDFLNTQIEKAQYGESFNMKFIEDLTGKKASHNEIFTVEPNDTNVAFVKDQSGMDVYSQKAQTPQMQRIKAIIDRKVKEATQMYNTTEYIAGKEKQKAGNTKEKGVIIDAASSIKVINPQGKVGYIPLEKKEAALKAGFKLAQ